MSDNRETIENFVDYTQALKSQIIRIQNSRNILILNDPGRPHTLSNCPIKAICNMEKIENNEESLT